MVHLHVQALHLQFSFKPQKNGQGTGIEHRQRTGIDFKGLVLRRLHVFQAVLKTRQDPLRFLVCDFGGQRKGVHRVAQSLGEGQGRACMSAQGFTSWPNCSCFSHSRSQSNRPSLWH